MKIQEKERKNKIKVLYFEMKDRLYNNKEKNNRSSNNNKDMNSRIILMKMRMKITIKIIMKKIIISKKVQNRNMIKWMINMNRMNMNKIIKRNSKKDIKMMNTKIKIRKMKIIIKKINKMNMKMKSLIDLF